MTTLLPAQTTDQHDISFTLPEISILDIEPDNTAITLQLDVPSDAGAPVTIASGGTNTSKWLNYTCALSPASTNRNIQVQISGGSVPVCLELKLEAAAASGVGAGTLGSSVGQIVLSNTAQNLVTGIGGSYTGDGSGNGHQLTYSLSIGDYSKLDHEVGSTLEVTFTITD